MFGNHMLAGALDPITFTEMCYTKTTIWFIACNNPEKSFGLTLCGILVQLHILRLLNV